MKDKGINALETNTEEVDQYANAGAIEILGGRAILRLNRTSSPSKVVGIELY